MHFAKLATSVLFVLGVAGAEAKKKKPTLKVSVYVGNLYSLQEDFDQVAHLASNVTTKNVDAAGKQLVDDLAALSTSASQYASEASKSANNYDKKGQAQIADAYEDLVQEAQNALKTINSDKAILSPQFSANLVASFHLLQASFSALGNQVIINAPSASSALKAAQASLAAALTTSIYAYGGGGIGIN